MKKTNGYAPVNGLNMYYETEGDGAPLVFIPAAFGFAGLKSFPALAKSHAVITVDLQGNGRTADIPDRREAMRLVHLLVDHAPAATPATYALAALMWLGAARLPGRIGEDGNLRALFAQDRSLWNWDLIGEGTILLGRSAAGEEITAYHVEAGIAALHARAARAEETPWAEIVAHYDVLMKIRPSPIVALDRAMALAEHVGPQRGLDAIGAIEDLERLGRYPFYPAALGELELRMGRTEAAKAHFRAAQQLARNDGERRYLEQRILDCDRRWATR